MNVLKNNADSRYFPFQLGFSTDVDSLLFADFDSEVFDKVPEEKVCEEYYCYSHEINMFLYM